QTHVLRLMHQSQHIRLRHANTFWFARRPGGEHHIRQVISTTAPPQVCPAPLPPLSLLSRTYHSHLRPITLFSLTQHQLRARGLQHVLAPSQRCLRIQRQISATSFQDPQQTHHQHHRPFLAHAHHHFRSNTLLL